MTLRVPSWAEDARLIVRPADGSTTEQAAAPGVVHVRRAFRDGDVVELHLPVEPRFTAADPRIDAVRGCLAVERGPEVLCLESVDLDAATAGAIPDVSAIELDPATPPQDVDGAVTVHLRPLSTSPHPWPYTAPAANTSATAERHSVAVPLVPYHDWAERGGSTMRVWLPVGTTEPPDH